MNKEELLRSIKKVSKATKWPKEEPDHAISGMVAAGKKRSGRKKAERKKNSR
jgi:hypothetical protein